MESMQDILKTPPAVPSSRGGKSKFKKLLPIVGVIVLIVVVVGGLFVVVKTKPEILGLQKSAVDTEAKLEDVVKEVGALMLLPDETPSLANVSDLSAVQGQDFFKYARVGDQILIYKIAKKAILYRPEENRIIEVGVVSEGSQAEVAGTSTSPTPTPIRETDIFLPSEPSPTPSATPEVSVTPTPLPTGTLTPTGILSPTPAL